MNKKELFKTSSQNGVTMYIDKSLNAVVDMDGRLGDCNLV